MQKILNGLSSKIFKEDLMLDFDNYGKAQQMQICNVVLYGLIYNLKKHNCQGLVDIM
jgi:hypothetical protein